MNSVPIHLQRWIDSMRIQCASPKTGFKCKRDECVFDAHWIRFLGLVTYRYGRPFHTRSKKRIQCALNAHSLCSHLNPVWGDAHWMSIEWIHLWRWIGRNRIHCLSYSPNNDKITRCYAPLNSNIVEALPRLRPPHTLYLPSKIRTTMAYHAGTLLIRCCRQRDRLPSGLL